MCIHCGIKDSNQANNKQWCARTPILVKFVSMIAVFLHQSPLIPNENKYLSIFYTLQHLPGKMYEKLFLLCVHYFLFTFLYATIHSTGSKDTNYCLNNVNLQN